MADFRDKQRARSLFWKTWTLALEQRKVDMSLIRFISGMTLAFICPPVQAQLKDEFHHDFRGGQLPPLVLQIVGPNASRYVRSAPEGLRISLPAEKAPFPQMGISLKLPVAGDFEITAKYQILKVDRPDAGYGSGVSMFIQTQSADNEAATLGLFLLRSDRLNYAANRHTGPKEKRRHLAKHVPAEEKARSGYLRLARSGSVLSYLVAPVERKEFIQLREEELGRDPIARLRIVADPGGSKGALEVVLSDLAIRADSLTTDSEKLERSSAWGRWIIGGGLGATAIAIGIFLWQRHQKKKTIKNENIKAPRGQHSTTKAQPHDADPN